MTEISRFFRVPLGEIAFVRAIVEAEEGLAQVCAADPNRGELELAFPAERVAEVAALVARLARATGWVEVPRPDDWPANGAR